MGILELILVIILLSWLFGGVIFPVGTSAIHLLLIIALVILVIRFSQGRSV